eukprot:1734444-Heterocapsa_arctica.AAC.1
MKPRPHRPGGRRHWRQPINPAAVTLAARASGVRSPLLVALWLASAFGCKLAKHSLGGGQKST